MQRLARRPCDRRGRRVRATTARRAVVVDMKTTVTSSPGGDRAQPRRPRGRPGCGRGPCASVDYSSPLVSGGGSGAVACSRSTIAAVPTASSTVDRHRRPNSVPASARTGGPCLLGDHEPHAGSSRGRVRSASIVKSQAIQSADDQRRRTKLESVSATSVDEMRHRRSGRARAPRARRAVARMYEQDRRDVELHHVEHRLHDDNGGRHARDDG